MFGVDGCNIEAVS